MDELKQQYQEKKNEIDERISSFNKLKEDASEERLFQELVFVILTSQSSAKNCWKCTLRLERQDIITNGSKEEISKVIEDFDITYSRNKASYIVENRKELSQPSFANPEPELNIRDKISESNISRTREWMAENLQGISWKGSSHFLRNIGYGPQLAVLSKPLMTQLTSFGKLKSPQPPKNKEEYLETEKKFMDFAKELNLSPVELDLTMWSMETGEVFK